MTTSTLPKPQGFHLAPARVAVGGAKTASGSLSYPSLTGAAGLQPGSGVINSAPAFDKIFDFSKEGADSPTGPANSDLRGNSRGISDDGSGVKEENDDNDWILNRVQDDTLMLRKLT